MNNPHMGLVGPLNRSHGPLRTQLGPVVERIAALYDHEERLRTDARGLELDPYALEEARRLFRRASAARRLRLALLRRWRLL